MPTDFHSAQAGCVLTPVQKQVALLSKGLPRYLFYQRCEVHGAAVCRCGWEFKKHPASQ